MKFLSVISLLESEYFAAMAIHADWYYDLAPKINRSAWEFLRKHQLAGDPQFKQYKY